MRFFYVTIFALRVEGGTVVCADAQVNQLCSSTACKCEADNDCNSDKKVCFQEGSGKKLIELTTANKLTAGENATAEKHFCVSAKEKTKVFKCVFNADAAENQACNPHGDTVNQTTVCPRSSTVLKAGVAATATNNVCIASSKLSSATCEDGQFCNPSATGSTDDPLCVMSLMPGEEAVETKKVCLNKVAKKIATCEIGKVCNPSKESTDAAKLCVDNTKVLGPGEVVDGERKLCIGSTASKECTGTEACKPFVTDATKLCVAKANVLKPGEKGGTGKKCFGKTKEVDCTDTTKACNPGGDGNLCTIDHNTLVKHGEEAKDAKLHCVGRIGFQKCNATEVCDASAPSGNMCLPKKTVLAENGPASGEKVCIATNGITRSKKCTGVELCKPGTEKLCEAPVTKKTCESFECKPPKVKDTTKNTTDCENETACKAKCCKDKPAALRSRTHAVGISATDIILFSLFGVLLSCVCLTFCRLCCVGG